MAPPRSTHSASGGGYGNNVKAELTATESDNDTPAITLSKATVEVTEGGTATYQVQLATEPSANVTVTVARKSGAQDTDLSVKTGASLTFTKTNWDTNQTVTLQAAQDNDHADGSAVFKHSASGGGYNNVTAELTATEDDDDTAAITLSKATITVSEGGTASYKVKLATQPSANVTVAVARKSGGDTNLSVKTGASLTFTKNNWNTDQTVTLQAAQDDDHVDGTATFDPHGQRRRLQHRQGGTRGDGERQRHRRDHAVHGDAHRERGRHRQLQGQARHRALRQRHRLGGPQVRRRHEPVGQDRRVPHLHQEELEHRPDRHPPSRGGRRPRQRDGHLRTHRQRRRLRHRQGRTDGDGERQRHAGHHAVGEHAQRERGRHGQLQGQARDAALRQRHRRGGPQVRRRHEPIRQDRRVPHLHQEELEHRPDRHPTGRGGRRPRGRHRHVHPHRQRRRLQQPQGGTRGDGERQRHRRDHPLHGDAHRQRGRHRQLQGQARDAALRQRHRLRGPQVRRRHEPVRQDRRVPHLHQEQLEHRPDRHPAGRRGPRPRGRHRHLHPHRRRRRLQQRQGGTRGDRERQRHRRASPSPPRRSPSTRTARPATR